MSHLLWELTKNSSSFLVRRHGVNFSSDPSNLSGRNLYSHSGLVHEYGLAISATKKDAKKSDPIIYHLRFNKRRRWLKAARKPAAKKENNNVHYKHSHTQDHLPVNGLQRAAVTIKKRFSTRRRDLAKLALRKLYLLHRANQWKKALHGGKAEVKK